MATLWRSASGTSISGWFSSSPCCRTLENAADPADGGGRLRAPRRPVTRDRVVASLPCPVGEVTASDMPDLLPQRPTPFLQTNNQRNWDPQTGGRRSVTSGQSPPHRRRSHCVWGVGRRTNCRRRRPTTLVNCPSRDGKIPEIKSVRQEFRSWSREPCKFFCVIDLVCDLHRQDSQRVGSQAPTGHAAAGASRPGKRIPPGRLP